MYSIKRLKRIIYKNGIKNANEYLLRLLHNGDITLNLFNKFTYPKIIDFDLSKIDQNKSYIHPGGVIYCNNEGGLTKNE